MTTAHLITAEDLWLMPPDGLRRELIQGELSTMSPSGSLHATTVINITLLVGQFVKDHHLGRSFAAEAGFILREHPDTVRAPDFAFVRQSRLPVGGITVKFWPGAPDLAVEVLSPTDSAVDVEKKVDDYLTAGTLIVWVINPLAQTVTVYEPGRDPRILRRSAILAAESLLPGLHLSVGRIFE